MIGRDRILLFREKEAKSFFGGCRGLGKLGGSVAGLVGFLLTCTAMADPAAVLVTTVPAQQGALPDILTAYGDAEPAQGSGTVISLPQDGRVAALLVTQGERVSAGTRLLVFNQAASVASAYAQALTALNLAQTERAHTAQLLAQRLATRDQMAQADKAAADAGARHSTHCGGRGRTGRAPKSPHRSTPWSPPSRSRQVTGWHRAPHS